MWAVVHRQRVLLELVLVSIAALTYFGVRNLTVGSADVAVANARRLERFEAWAGIAWEEALQATVLGNDELVMLANWVYIWGHWPVIVITAIWLFRNRRERYYLLRNAIFLSGAVGFLFFALFPVAPPRLVDPALVDTVTEQSNSYRALQPPGLTNQYAAFPSLHLGWNVLVGIVLFSATSRLLVHLFAAALPAAMALAIVVTANHYVIDAVAGTTLVLLALGALTIPRLVATLGRDGRHAQSVRRRAPRRQRPHAPRGRRAIGGPVRRG